MAAPSVRQALCRVTTAENRGTLSWPRTRCSLRGRRNCAATRTPWRSAIHWTLPQQSGRCSTTGRPRAIGTFLAARAAQPRIGRSRRRRAADHQRERLAAGTSSGPHDRTAARPRPGLRARHSLRVLSSSSARHSGLRGGMGAGLDDGHAVQGPVELAVAAALSRISLARRSSRFSRSSCFRRSRSSLVSPGRRPRSISPWWTQARSDSTPMPKLGPPG